MITDEGLRR